MFLGNVTSIKMSTCELFDINGALELCVMTEASNY